MSPIRRPSTSTRIHFERRAIRQRPQAEANAQIDDGNHVAAMIGDAHHRGGACGSSVSSERIDDLAHLADRHGVRHVADDEADQALLWIGTGFAGGCHARA